ncbi:response regulator [Desulfobacula toluolica]|uniref:Tetratricopeptide repeat modulated response regulator n=1 Tax=Desulfobacula toluolica (strain DSM 7467 / Tol2) TaxID=651182 RepID=K0NT37_DESTT|nr:response regulator [Desulfobacula toluolica]CCK82202.1 tetratricopeptide repeat modulated response regulator [Desulfobacula toluolica Tol2]
MQKNKKEHLNTCFLIISYHPIIKSLIREILKKNNFKNYFFANNGYEALKIIKSNEKKVDFIISDWDMPIINGIELLKILKNDPEFFMLSFMLLSKSCSVELRRIYATEENADIFMTIPFKEDEMISCIINYLNSMPEKSIFKEMVHNKLNNNYMEVLTLGLQLEDMSTNESILAGESLYHLKKYNQAKRLLNKALSKEKNSKIYDLLGKIHFKQGNNLESLKNFELAKKQNPLNMTRSINLVREYLLQGKPKKALKIITHILKSNPTYLDLIEIANLYLGTGYLDRAYKILKFLKPINENAQIFYICCVKLWQKKAHKKSLNLLTHCINELPQNHLFLYYLGTIFLKKGALQLSHKYIRMALKINPDYEPGKRCIEYLEDHLKLGDK